MPVGDLFQLVLPILRSELHRVNHAIVELERRERSDVKPTANETSPATHAPGGAKSDARAGFGTKCRLRAQASR